MSKSHSQEHRKASNKFLKKLQATWSLFKKKLKTHKKVKEVMLGFWKVTIKLEKKIVSRDASKMKRKDFLKD